MMHFESIGRRSRRVLRPLNWKASLCAFTMVALAVFAACTVLDGQAMRNEKRLVLFTFMGEADTVCLSGDFNGWSPDSRCLERRGDRWEIEALLSPGRYTYGFVLDGKDWVPDPGALMNEEDGFGKKNSVLVIE